MTVDLAEEERTLLHDAKYQASRRILEPVSLLSPVPAVSPLELAALVLAAFFAGAVDAIGGGGGLIMVPALLAVGLPPHLALGTNKGQSLFGSLAAAVRYARAGLVDWRAARVTFPLAFLGALAGAALVSVIRPEVLRPLVLGLLVLAAETQDQGTQDFREIGRAHV